MNQPRKVSYAFSLIRRVANLLGRELYKAEMGIMFKLAKLEFRDITDHTLRIYEQNSGTKFVGVKTLYSMVMGAAKDSNYNEQDFANAVTETKDWQERGKNLLNGIMDDSDTF